MKLEPLGEMELLSGPWVTFVDYGSGGRIFATLEGSWHSERISGKLRLTNLATKRADDVNVPTLRGVLETEDGASIFVEIDGLAQLQTGRRVFVASLTLRTGNPAYAWVNTLFAVIEGSLQGPPRPNASLARCKVYACEATITTEAEGGNRQMETIAYALQAIPSRERRSGVRREVAYLQPTPSGNLVLIYRELEKAEAATDAPPVELLVRQRPPARGSIYLTAVPLLPGKTGRLHEFASELNGVHAAEYEASLSRLGIGLCLFLQHTPQIDLVITAIEGSNPGMAFGALMASQHPFDRWHMKQIADLHGIDFSGPPPPPNQELWSWEETAIETR